MRAARRASGVDVQIDANEPVSIGAVLRAGDVVLDGAGPFQDRNTALVEAALEIGFDVVDLSDSLAYAMRVTALRDRLDRSRARILTSCSAVSAVSAALITLCGIAEPVRASVFLAPASSATANRATIASFLRSVGKPVVLCRAGQLASAIGWKTSRRFSWPGRPETRGYLTESADALLLPQVWPSLRDVDFFVDTQMPGVNSLLRVGATFSSAAELVGRLSGLGAALARRLGATAGAFGVEVEGADGSLVRRLLFGRQQSYLIAIAPAVLAARTLADDRLEGRGLLPVNRQVDAKGLISELATAGMVLA